MGIEAVNLNNYAVLPSILSQNRISGEATPVVTTEDTQTTASFADLLKEAIADTVGTDATAKDSAVSLLLGQDLDLHNVAIDAEKAELVLNLTIQMRNKMVESYQEIMRMSI